MLRHAPRPDRCSRAGGGARGFTLLELIVTITLLGLLVTLSFPSFSSWMRNSQTRTVAEALQGGLRTAQNEALRRNRRVVMFFTDDNPAKDVVAVTHPESGAAPKLGGKNWALQTAPDAWGASEYISGGTLTDVASNVKIANAGESTDPLAVCFNASGRVVAAAAAASGAAVTGLATAECKGQLTSFNVTQTATGFRRMRVIVQLGGQIRMCDPDRPALSAASPEGCP